MVGGLNADRAAVLEALKLREGFLKIPTLFCKNPAGFMPAGDDFFVSAGEIDGETVWGNLAEGVISTGLESLLLRRILVLKQPDSCLLHRSPCAKTTPSENGVSLFAALLLSCALCPLWDNHCAEGWQSGRMRRTRNPVYGYTVSRVRIPPLPPSNEKGSRLAGLCFMRLPRLFQHRRTFRRFSDLFRRVSSCLIISHKIDLESQYSPRVWGNFSHTFPKSQKSVGNQNAWETASGALFLWETVRRHSQLPLTEVRGLATSLG